MSSYDEDDLIDSKQLELEQLSKYIYDFVQEQGKAYDLNVSEK